MSETLHTLRRDVRRTGERRTRSFDLHVAGGRIAAAGAAVLISAIALVFALAFASHGSWEHAVIAGTGAAIGGLLVLLGAYVALPFAERAFRVTSRTRLLELSSPSHPLLRELMSEAPGTYSHSMLAGNMAETAAGEIGADQLLARVGAYYHDIGKMGKAAYFVENQAGAPNPHDHTEPMESAQIITSHVCEGVRMAEMHHLPKAVIDIVRQHHGDTVVACFFEKAKGHGPATEADFRYPSSRPQSREAALVMLADSAEAAVRGTRSSTFADVEASVRRVVDQKVADGQLADCGLAEDDLEVVERVYAGMLASIYHPRMAYPGDGGADDAGQCHQPS